MNYHNSFSSWEDVQHEFSISDPEPDIVLFASYDQDGYEGSADVFYYDKGKFYYAHGSHCSCYGLESQWDPEECSLEYLRGQLDRATYGFFKDQKELIIKAVNEYMHPITELAIEYSALVAKALDAEKRRDAADAELTEIEPKLDNLREEMKKILN